ncbi:hypothetical protein EVU96_24770 [Bacillus infantis]|uniref:hypothetical protein n=1 Tax=Bacillus infantis TaxID=324767 RepID=UPI00101D6F6E|nr:hypothetical protein [Bacillus infantis]RYI25182.1 hypothetical protein EVU96_24770 [Bacillus infantis]
MEEKKKRKVMKFNEQAISEYLSYNEKESDTFMPNEIFSDILKRFKEEAANKPKEPSIDFIKVQTVKGLRKKRGQNEGANSKHIAFTYSYYYLIAWLYRYAKYDVIKITAEDIKEILGYSRTNTEVDYIIKKGGILDEINYTQATTDYPLTWHMNEDKQLEFFLLSDCNEESKVMKLKEKGRNFKVKYPVKHFHRSLETFETGECDGLFYEPYDFDNVPFEVFLFCMGKKELGVRGFYLYCYIMRMNGYYGGGFDASYERLSEETGIPITTLEKDLRAVREYRMVNVIYGMEYFVPKLGSDERKANTYTANSYSAFSDTKIKIKTIDRMSLKDYQQMQADKQGAPTMQDIDDQMWGLLPSNL